MVKERNLPDYLLVFSSLVAFVEPFLFLIGNNYK